MFFSVTPWAMDFDPAEYILSILSILGVWMYSAIPINFSILGWKYFAVNSVALGVFPELLCKICHCYSIFFGICFWLLRRSVRSCSQTIPEALAKIWRAAGSEVRAFSYMVRTLRSIAFQRCIWRGGHPLVEMAENEDFLQKKAWKTAF